MDGISRRVSTINGITEPSFDPGTIKKFSDQVVLKGCYCYLGYIETSSLEQISTEDSC